MMFLDWMIEPLSHAFMQRALVCAIVIASVCGFFSCFLVLKGWSLMGDAVSHSVLPGVSLAYMLHLPFSLGAFVSGFFCAVLTGFVKGHTRIKDDTVMGIVFSGMFALGLILLTKMDTDQHLMHVLFGNILGISQTDFFEILSVSCVCFVVMWVYRRTFILFCFDPAFISSMGMSVRWLRYALLVLLSLTIVAALKAAGIIMAIALLITPGAIGFLLSRTFDQMVKISLMISVLTSFFGVVLSYHLDVSTAPLIVILQSVVFLYVFLQSQRKNVKNMVAETGFEPVTPRV
jgi:manganese/iron transport system permease protein